jgi:DNA repair photolyase
MNYKTIRCSSLLNKITKRDALFLGDYTIDPYQNCEFGCKYCDSSNTSTIYIKTNASEVLEYELENSKKGRVIIGSVHDPYQNIEKDYQITRKILKIILKNGFSCHILTKSDLVLRDIDLISQIKNSFITVSLISLDTKISDIFEKNLLTPLKRLKVIENLSLFGIKSGVAVIPVLPYVVEHTFENIFIQAKKYKAKYILHKYLELMGDQKDVFINCLKDLKLDLIKKYKKLYEESYKPRYSYIKKIDRIFEELGILHNLNTSLDFL